jgi:hypothetical protein
MEEWRRLDLPEIPFFIIRDRPLPNKIYLAMVTK